MLSWDEVRHWFRVGDAVELTTDSPLYRGPYTSTVVALTDSSVRIAMPLDAGKLVLIPVGTTVNVRTEREGRVWTARVVDRLGGGQRLLELASSRSEDEEVLPPAGGESGEEPAKERRGAPLIAVTSGKGGVGKSTFTVNLATALAELGKRVCVIDGDLGTANIDVLWKLSPAYTLGDVVNGSRHMVEVLIEGPHGVLVLPGGSGLRHLVRLPDEAFEELMRQFRELEAYVDAILLDTGSGIAPNVTHFVGAAAEVILLTTPEPHAIADAYALLKVLCDQGTRPPVHLVVNRVQSEREGVETARRMAYAAWRFLRYEVESLGVIREDPAMVRAVRSQVDVMTEYPRSKAAADIRRIAEETVSRMIDGESGVPKVKSDAETFLRRIRSWLPAFGRERSAVEQQG